MKCRQCGSTELERTTVDHHYLESGLPNVHLRSIPARKCTACGALRIAIPAIESLHRAIALALLKKQTRLTGREVRFLRKYIGLSGVDFARRIGATPEAVSRWETDLKPIGPQSERLLRLLVVTMGQVQEYPIESFDSIDSKLSLPADLTLERSNRDWRPVAA